MRGEASWIAGLMRENYEAVGFLPESAVQRYLDSGLAIIEHDTRGRRVGYLLHGPVRYGRPLRIVQHCIEIDRRLLGFGEDALQRLVACAVGCGAAAVLARCAVDLPSLGFWHSQGFDLLRRVPGGVQRQREIAMLALLLPLALDLGLTNPSLPPGTQISGGRQPI